MRQLWKKDEPTKLDAEIDIVLSRMNNVGPDTEEYDQLLTKLERLHKLKAKDRPQQVSRDTIVSTAGNLLGILLVVVYEQKHVWTTKAFSTGLRTKK